jgi:DNA-binding ferritin-like protein
MEIYMISTVNLVLPNGKPVKMAYGMKIPLTASVEDKKSIAWGWGPTRNRYLKGIESLCGELSDQGNIASTMSVEGSGIGDNVKKIIAWIAEKMKLLAKIIKDFFEKVKNYITGTAHKKIYALKNKALEKLKAILNSSDPDNDTVKSLMQLRLMEAYYSAQQFLSLHSKKESIIEKADEIKEKSRALAEKAATDVKSAFEVLRNYDIILSASELIQNLIAGFQKNINEINTRIRTIGSSVGEAASEQVFELRNKTKALADTISKLFSLNITQAVPTIDRSIVKLCRDGNIIDAEYQVVQ